MDTFSRDDSFVADTGYNVDGDKGYKWIQLVSDVSGVNAALRPARHQLFASSGPNFLDH